MVSIFPVGVGSHWKEKYLLFYFTRLGAEVDVELLADGT